jgi:hypothetical protein
LLGGYQFASFHSGICGLLWESIKHPQRQCSHLLGIQGTTLALATQFGREPNAPPSRGFFRDLVSESGEPEVSRLQLLVWNGILGVIFLWQSIFQWAMPEFDATLMTLLGISSAAYVGFKIAK